MYSESEKNGLRLLSDSDRSILSVGISTGGMAEVRMVEANHRRRVTATTLDEQGADLVRKKIQNLGLENQITVRVEDIAEPQEDIQFDKYDFVYARLVLHYLTKQELGIALNNTVSSLKSGGRVFVVVRSTDCDEAQPDSVVDYDPVTEMTTYRVASGEIAVRRFHTVESISSALVSAGLTVDSVQQFDEYLSPGFSRDTGVWVKNNLIQVIAHK